MEQIFGHALIKLIDKLINTTDKEENQIIVKNIEKNKDKLFKEEKKRPYNFVIQPNSQRINLINAINLISKFNEEFNYENENENEDNEKEMEKENEKLRKENESKHEKEKNEKEKLRKESENEKAK